MKIYFDGLLRKISERIKDEIVDNDEMLNAVLHAYNQWQEDERDGADYIFSLDNQKDLECLVRGGMTAKEICGLELKNGHTNSYTKYFFYGQNHYPAEQIKDNEQLIFILTDSLYLLRPYVFLNPSSYRELYELLMYEFIFRTYIEE